MDAKQRFGRIASIDILRGIAILWVIGYHTWTDLRFPDVYPQQADAFREIARQLADADLLGAVAAACEALLRVGYLGVPLFMLLSGYSLTLSALGRDATPRREWRSAPRRLRRVLVPYWAAFGITVTFAVALATVQWQRHGGAPLSDFIRNGDINLHNDQIVAGVLLVPRMFKNEWQFAPPGALWFVLVIVQYYLLFSISLRALRRFGAGAVVIATLAINVMALLLMIGFAGDLLEYRSWLEMAAPFRLFEFGLGIGMAAFVLSARKSDASGVGGGLVSDKPVRNVLVALAGAVLLVAGCMVPLDAGYASALQWPLVIGGLGLMALPVLAARELVFERTLPGRTLASVGVVSYAVLIINEPLRSITHTMRAEGASGAWLVAWVVAGLLPLSFLLARPLAKVLGLVSDESAVSVRDLVASPDVPLPERQAPASIE